MDTGLPSIIKARRSELRLAALCLAILLTATIMVTWLLAAREQADQTAEIQDRLGRVLKGRSPVLATEIATHRSDILFLAATPAVGAVVEGTGGPGQAGDLDRLATIFSAFLRYHPDVRELRLIGVRDGGREMIRVERLAGGEIRSIPDAMLQRKGDRDFFTATSLLAPGRLHVSDIALSRDPGPGADRRPVMRFSTPLYRTDGALYGLIIANIDARPLLAKLGTAIADGFALYLANSRGDFAINPAEDKVFAADLGGHWRFGDEFPEFLHHGLQERESGKHRSGGRLLQARYQRIPIPGDPSRSFILAVSADNALVTAAVRQSVIGDLPIFLAVDLLLASLTVWYFSQRRAKDLEAVNRELSHRTKEAEAATLAKSAFLANMSHELRTPLNAIIGLGHLLADADLPPREQDYVKKLSQAGESLLSLINDILDFSKIEAGRLMLEETAVSLEEIARKVAILIEPVRHDAVEVILDIDPRLPAGIMGDPLRLTQILLNLVGNAAKFTRAGEIVLAIALVDETETSARLRFSVKDSGIGIAPIQLAGLFQAFTQAESSTSRRYGGTGLGLAISSRLVELMGGRLQCESEAGQGSLFWFVIETAKAKPVSGAARRAPPAKSAEAVSLAGRLPAFTLLLVEDNPVNQLVAQALLTRAGAKVVVAGDGAAAIKELRAGPEKFDAVLMDVQMPGLDGYETTAAIREGLGLQALPIIAMTANALPEDREKSLKAGMQGHVTKPIDVEELFAVLTACISRRFGALPEGPLM